MIRNWVRVSLAVVLFVDVLLLSVLELCNGGITSKFARKNGISADMPADSDVFQVPPGYNAPQQVHITQGDLNGQGVIVSWITADEPGSNTVVYWAENSTEKTSSDGILTTYKYFNYTSGFIRHCTITGLEFDTKYYYEVGIGNTTRQFWFITPPQSGPDVPYTFGLIGDLGQTYDSNRTLTHYELNPAKGKTLLFVGDLSYADDYPFHENTRWDTWGRFIERNAAYQPWIWTAGNHEIDFAPNLMNPTRGQTMLFVGDLSYADAYLFHDNTRWDTWGRFIERNTAHQPWIWTAGNHEIDFLPNVGESVPFKPYTHRFHVPYHASESTTPFWYSIKRASAYIIVMASYSAFGKYTPQYKWLVKELPKVNRTETPWLIVIMHCPMYSSYVDHYMEGETMRVMYEPYFVKYKVDVVFAGHVHAYERSERVSNIAYNITNGLCMPISDESAPVYITIGDGGNQEGLATEMTQPQPAYSAYREASYGHGIFDIKNRTHAYFSWHRNQDGYAVEADSQWMVNRYWIPNYKSRSAPSM